MAATALQEAVQRQLASEDHAAEVDVDHPLRGLVVLVDEAAELHDAGVVDEHVERPELGLRLVEELVERRAVGDVEVEADRAATELLGRAAGRLGIDVADRDTD